MSDHGTGIEAHGVGFTYPGGVRVVESWDATFAAGSMTALTGPSGTGKSTLLYVLGLAQRPTSGEVRLGAVATSRLRDPARARLRARRIGFVFQDAALDPTRSVLDNVVETALYRGESRPRAVARARELLDELGVGLRLGHRPGQVSGGQAQRVALCRALLSDPACLLADEPTGNLDPATRDVVVRTLQERARAGACVIVATHDPEVVAACDTQVRLVAS